MKARRYFDVSRKWETFCVAHKGSCWLGENWNIECSAGTATKERWRACDESPQWTLQFKVIQWVLLPQLFTQHSLWPHLLLLLLLQGFRNPTLCPTGTLLHNKAGLGTRRAAFRSRWWMHSSCSALLLCCWAQGVACGVRSPEALEPGCAKGS